MARFVAAQDTQYWTQQFGTRSALMGGAVVGGVKDNTAIFYNPGGMGFIDTTSVSINANLYRFENINIENALGQTKGFKSAGFTSFPVLVSGMVATRNPRLKLGYGLVVPVDFSFKATARVDGDYAVVPDDESPGLESFIGQVAFNSRVNETSVGLAIGYRLGQHFSIGLTNLFSLHSQSFTKASLSRFYLNTTDRRLVSSDVIQNFSYNSFRYNARLGLTWLSKNVSIGLVATSPGLRMFGKGVVAVDITANDIKYNGNRIDLLANDRQGKLKADFKSPFMVAAGINIRFHRSEIGVATQYNAAQDVYDVLQAKPAAFVRPPEIYPNLGSDEFMRVKGGAKAVWNVSVGYEYLLSDVVTLNASVRSDRSYFDKDVLATRGIKPTISTWDIYHFVGGATLRSRRSTLSLGVLIGSGKDNNREQEGNLSTPSEDNFLSGSTTITQATYHSIGLLIGFTFNFKKP